MSSHMNVSEKTNSEISDEDLQRPNIYNQHLPCYQTIKQQAKKSFEEIQENLSRSIQLGDFHDGFRMWSFELRQFIAVYGYFFTKPDHIKLVQYYISILTITELNCIYASTCFELVNELLQKTRLINRDELTIDWRILYRWAEFSVKGHDSTYSLMTLPRDFEYTLLLCARRCSPYFSPLATQEILDEIRPKLFPIDNISMSSTIRLLESFLPLNLPPSFHSQGYQLWLSEFFTIWQNIYHNTLWENNIIRLLARLSWNNIGYIDWEPWLPKIFTRFLRGLSIPVGSMSNYTSKYTYDISYMSTWIIGMLGNGSACLEYLRDLFTATKSFYHPSNTGRFQKRLIEFILNLARHFVNRLHLEKKNSLDWYFLVPESYRLTDQDVMNFVNCIKEYAFISIFNKDYGGEAAEACQYLAMIRPELIIPPIVDKLFLSIHSSIETDRYTSLMYCLKRMTRSLVRQTSIFSQGQTYILPLLTAILPGIDLNDLDKTSVTLDFFDGIFMLISCIDCSSAVTIRTDLTEIEKEVCLSTAKFEEFIAKLLDRIFEIINVLSTDMSDGIMNHEGYGDNNAIQLKLTSIMTNIVRQCSQNIFQMILKKITNFVCGSIFLPKVRPLVGGLVGSIVKWHPVEILKCLLVKTCESIEKSVEKSVATLKNDHKDDLELNWHLSLFGELVQARGDTLMIYRDHIKSVFRLCIRISQKDSHEAIARAIQNLLKSFLNVYIVDYRLTKEDFNDSFVDFLPIRTWGENVDFFDQIQPQFHIPNVDEINFACDFINTFIYPELTLLKENFRNISKHDVRRSLTIINSIVVGCFRLVPRIESEVEDLVSSLVPWKSIAKSLYPTYYEHANLNFQENLRMRILIDIGKFLDMLIENQSDDVIAIKKAISIYASSSVYYGMSSNSIFQKEKDVQSMRKLIRNDIIGERDNPSCLIINHIELQIELFESKNNRNLTQVDKEVGLKLFDLSIARYSEVRRFAQSELFYFLSYYFYSWVIIIDRIVDLLNTSKDTDDTQIKGCLYILSGNNDVFLLARYSWIIMRKLWPLFVRRSHAKKRSVQQLIEEIKKKIERNYTTVPIIVYTNQISVQTASTLWHPLESNEIEIGIQIREKYNETNIQLYNYLIDDLCSLVDNETLTWSQKKIGMFLLCRLLQRDVPIPSSCIDTCLNCLTHGNIELRKYAAQGIAAFCRLQKLPLTYVEKPMDEILHDIDQSMKINVNNRPQPGDRIDNLWATYNNYKPPKIQEEWEQICFLDKNFHGYYQWPKTIKYPLNKRDRYSRDQMPKHVAIIFNRFLDKNYITKLTKVIIFDEDPIRFDKIRFLMYKGLFRNFGFEFVDIFIEQIYTLIREQTIGKYEMSHRAAAEMVAGMIRGSKYWTLEMLDELWKKLTPLLTEITINLTDDTYMHWGSCFQYCLRDTDPRRMFHPINFICKWINHPQSATVLAESQRWYLIQCLQVFQWRIPSIWYMIYEKVKELLDHSSKIMRKRIGIILTISFGMNLALFDGKSIHHPNIPDFFNMISERLRQAIDTYERKPLTLSSGSGVEIDSETRQALNLIETVVELHLYLFLQSNQPVTEAIVSLFPYLCEIESINTKDDDFPMCLKISRTSIGMSYYDADLLNALIKQLEYVSTIQKWRARQAAMEFVPTLVFCNLFNAKHYAKRLHELVLKCLGDEQVEVRLTASAALSGFYQCGYLKVTEDDIKHFLLISNTDYSMQVNGKKIISTKDIVKRHSGVLGLCAIVLANPYDVPSYVPNVLMDLCAHSHDPQIIQKSIKDCLSEFRRTHFDSWNENKKKFTNYQLETLTEMLIPSSCYT